MSKNKTLGAPRSIKQEKDETGNDPIIVEACDWANSLLSQKGREIKHFLRDFSDGTNFLLLYQILTKKKLSVAWFENPKTISEKRKNVGALLMMLHNNRYIKPGVVKADDIVWGQLAAIYAVVRALNIHLGHGKLPPLTRNLKNSDVRTIQPRPNSAPEPIVLPPPPPPDSLLPQRNPPNPMNSPESQLIIVEPTPQQFEFLCKRLPELPAPTSADDFQVVEHITAQKIADFENQLMASYQSDISSKSQPQKEIDITKLDYYIMFQKRKNQI